MKLSFLYPILLAALAGCSASKDSRLDRHRVEIDGVNIVWADYQRIAKSLKGKVHVSDGEGIYLFSRSGPQISFTLSNGLVAKITENGFNCLTLIPTEDPNWQALHKECHNGLNQRSKAAANDVSFVQFLQLAETAVNRDAACQWLGYDRGFDFRIRALVKAASFSDERLFFAKLKC